MNNNKLFLWRESLECKNKNDHIDRYIDVFKFLFINRIEKSSRTKISCCFNRSIDKVINLSFQIKNSPLICKFTLF